MDMTFVPIRDWGLPVGETFLAAGPCSAESEEQVLATAKGLAERDDISLFRAGLWKPRTRPGNFEGVGIEGLRWLKRVKDELGLPVGVEVASSGHVLACLAHGVDLVWIGARTTPNPFAVQEIADALRGSDMRVLVKNPISPDLDLWMGAVERLYSVGLSRIGVIHRGFSTARKVLYRFTPDWRVPIELKRRLPDIPIICDPSHICGKRELLFSIAQEALDLLFDGLMIEVHIDPSQALSDAAQQLTPDELIVLMDRLTLKKERSDDEAYQARIKELRAEVDHLDEHLLEILGKRMSVVDDMGELKRQRKVSPLQPHRWEEIIESRQAMGQDQALSENFVFHLFEAIHEEAIHRQVEAENRDQT